MTTYTYRTPPRRVVCTCGRPHVKPDLRRRMAALNHASALQAVASNA